MEPGPVRPLGNLRVYHLGSISYYSDLAVAVGIGGCAMPRRSRRAVSVRLSAHASRRWQERAGRSAGNLARLIQAQLLNQLRLGLTIKRGQALLILDAEALNLPRDLIACLELPDSRGVWKVVTFKQTIRCKIADPKIGG